jgi:hypothetical protein
MFAPIVAGIGMGAIVPPAVGKKTLSTPRPVPSTPRPDAPLIPTVALSAADPSTNPPWS